MEAIKCYMPSSVVDNCDISQAVVNSKDFNMFQYQFAITHIYLKKWKIFKKKNYFNISGTTESNGL